MFAVKGSRTEPVTYWFTMGNQVVLSRTERFVVQLKYAMSGIIPDGMLVRVSNITADPEAGYKAQAAFLDEMMRAVDPQSSDKLLGGPAVN